MSLTCRNTYDFTDDAGFEFESGEVEFVAEIGLRTTTGFHGETLVLSPNEDVTSDDIVRMGADLTEAPGYSHRFMLSFDSSFSWWSAVADAWVPFPIGEIRDAGMTRMQLEAIRNFNIPGFPMGPSSMRLAILINRDEGAGRGSLRNFDICEGMDTPVISVEPTGTFVFNDEEDLVPDRVVSYDAMIPAADHLTMAGYVQKILRVTKARRGYTFRWTNRTTAERAKIRALIREFSQNNACLFRLRGGEEEVPITFTERIRENQVATVPVLWDIEANAIERMSSSE